MRLLPVRTLQREKEKDHVIIFIEDQKKKNNNMTGHFK